MEIEQWLTEEYLNRRELLKRLGVVGLMTFGLGILAACGTSSRSTTGTVPPASGVHDQHVIFVSNRTGSYNIFDKNLDTNELVQLTSGSANNMNPQASLDGNSLVFYSDRSGSNQIHTLKRASPSSVVQLTQGAPSYDPVYSLDGSQVLYKQANADGNFGHIWRMGSDGSSQEDLTANLETGWEAWKPAPIDDRRVVFTVRQRPRDANSDDLFVSIQQPVI